MKVLHIIRNEGKVGGVEFHIKYLVKEQLGIDPVGAFIFVI